MKYSSLINIVTLIVASNSCQGRSTSDRRLRQLSTGSENSSTIYNFLAADPEQYSTEDNEVGTINWVRGSAHAPGSVEWIGVDAIGEGTTPGGKLNLGMFNMTQLGEVRTSHWHPNANELSYIISGKCRVTVTSVAHKNLNGISVPTVEQPHRPTETFLLGPGDAFYAPVGFSHHFENVDGSEPLVGIAIFNTDNLESFDMPQVMKHIDADVLSRTLDIPVDMVEKWYTGPRTVLDAPTPEWNSDSLANAESGPSTMIDYLVSGIDQNLREAPRSDTNGKVSTGVVDANDFPILQGMSIAYTEIAPGAVLEPYWTDNADELIYVLEGIDVHVGKADMRGTRSGTWDVETGYLVLNEVGVTVYIENRGTEPVKLLRIFNYELPTLTTLHDSYVAVPVDVAASMLHVDGKDTGLAQS
ncbi:hypothetical protein SARC_05461 [Sphaeroforma arctica JP610]|uniref:Cupin type-1 domain-containing protein n=1 Tax=Sphaeroforma arctica JP610 TaxID=667725 RepID=A0A0L0G075_9EUKA|nr:hypothetical protein SARC_05461 [Sphaeroforma arctica JP610]KNC82254.1 hypothetical protein SARC_05461 [Sphaeroforma arctica JP610]|eukprot:XP_014156156.1 hypothetical protein SARC_05461 [Sphaeroforma arctica JP610]